MGMRRGATLGVLTGTCLLVLSLAWTAGPVGARQTANDGVIEGVVRSDAGPEAGVWVIAETDDLSTKFAKIVVTDDDGRYLLPELPSATYDLWVRGYGLVDSEKVSGRPGQELSLRAVLAPTPQDAAQIYPANYWYSLVEVPDKSEFPGTGPDGNGISPAMTSQAVWVDRMKQGCQLCHQLGNRITREVDHLDEFDSAVAAWDHRVQTGQRGASMNAGMNRFGRGRGLQMYSEWTERIAAGELPPVPPRPSGVERNLVLTMWDWGVPTAYIHDEIVTDKRNPRVNANGPVYSVDAGHGTLVVTNPYEHTSTELTIPVRVEPETIISRFPNAQLEPSYYYGDELLWGVAPSERSDPHNPMMDAKGRVWMTSTIRGRQVQDWCGEGSDHPSAQYFPLSRSGRHASYYDPATDEFELIDTCFSTHHLQFGEDPDDTLWFSGSGNVVAWINTRLYDETGDERASQGWCPKVLDTNADGRITRPWNEPSEPVDPMRDTRIGGGFYGVIANPIDHTVWGAETGPFPGRLVRVDRGNNPPETCIAEVYEPPSIENPDVNPAATGHAPRGIDVDRNGIIWTALSGSGHMASFDRSQCRVLSGPEATGQHCPEGWTLYPTPGPQMRGVTDPGSGDFHYYNWVDQFNTLGLGENIPIANGSGSDSLLALHPDTGEWTVLRIPYPLGFFSRGLDGRIDDPDGGWKGRGLWANYGGNFNWHIEGGKGTPSKMVHFQLRPDPLAE